MKSAFLTAPGLLPQRDGKNFRLDAPLRARLPDGSVVEAPAQTFVTDLASIPPLGFLGGMLMLLGTRFADLEPLLWAGFFICVMSIWLKNYGFYTYAAVIHDWIFQTHAFSFTKCNWILFVLMRDSMTTWREWPLVLLIWFNVQCTGIGWVIYQFDRPKTK